jgi:coenzyme F420-reducing hydrogenase delta subunit
MPGGLHMVQLPCCARVSEKDLLTAFNTNADGVLVLTCHDDNCHSGKGNRFARERVSQMRTSLKNIGLERERLMVKTLASNMGFEFAEIVTAFEKELKMLGPSRLKS